jgi:steroid 5-alpha reductase family enzyme
VYQQLYRGSNFFILGDDCPLFYAFSGTNKHIPALLTLLLGQSYHPRNVITSVFVLVWAMRIGGFLLYRVLKIGSDNRFDDIRSKFLSFLGFWVAQILWVSGQDSYPDGSNVFQVWVVSFPVTFLNSPSVTGTPVPNFGTPADIAGVVIWVVGWLLEAQADIAKVLFPLLL